MTVTSLQLELDLTNKMKEVFLEHRDIELVKMISIARDVTNRMRNAKDLRGSPNREIGYQGLLGEYAFAKKLNLFLNLTLEIDARDHYIDFDLPNGKTCDVKTTQVGGESLNVNASKKDHPDIYVLAMVSTKEEVYDNKMQRWAEKEVYPPKVYMYGWISSDDFLRESKLIRPKHGTPFHALPITELNTRFTKKLFMR